MGNADGILSSMMLQGTNKVININKTTYFSFAFGNEIALCWKSKCYILNYTKELWGKTNKKLKETKKLEDIKKWWIKMSSKYEKSDWSDDFKDLR